MYEQIKYATLDPPPQGRKSFARSLLAAVFLSATTFWYFNSYVHHTQEDWTSIRLPSFIKPIYYNLSFGLEDVRFKGKVNIHLEISQQTKFIVIVTSYYNSSIMPKWI
jgi:hypothetical protein